MDLNNIDFLGIKITILISMRSNIINILLNNSINQITNLLLNLLGTKTIPHGTSI